MKRLLFLLIPCLLFGQNTISLSPYQYGGDWQVRHDAMREKLVEYLEQDLFKTVDIWWMDSYGYNVSDSSFAVPDLSQENVLLLFRYVEPPNCGEATVETNYINYTKNIKSIRAKEKIKLDSKGYKYTGWGHTKIEPLKKADVDMAKEQYKAYKAQVKAFNEDGKDWYKDNKKLNKNEKHSAAWKIVTGKIKESEIEKR